MSLFHKLRDVYFDAVKLREELDRIPAECDCGDGAAHLAGLCCCAGSQSSRMTSDLEYKGCLGHLQKLSRDVEWFEEDARRERKNLLPLERPIELERRLFAIENIINSLRSMIGRLESDLMTFRETCAHDTLVSMKNRSGELAKQIAELNKAL